LNAGLDGTWSPGGDELLTIAWHLSIDSGFNRVFESFQGIADCVNLPGD
jgi:hypothetical protein